MSQRPATFKGIACMLAAMAVLPFIDVCAKFLGQQSVPIFQMVWARFFFGALFTLPFALRTSGVQALRPKSPGHQVARASLLIAGTAFFFWSLKYLPIADTLAIYFVQPLLITALSPIVLGEQVNLRRWATVGVGFLGVLVIIRPGFNELNPGVLLALAAGASSAFYILLTRHITGTAPAVVTTFQTSAAGAIFLTACLPLFWSDVNGQQWTLFVLLGLIAIAGHYLITRAYDYAEASLLSPLAYTEMIMAVIAGWYFFGDFPDVWTFAGVGVLVACAIFISAGERSRARPAIVTPEGA